MKHRVIFELIQDFFVSLTLTIVGVFLSGGHPVIAAFLLDVLFAWGVNLVIGFLVPEKRMGENLCRLLKVPDKAGFWVVMAVIVVINVVGISFCVSLKNVGLHLAFFGVWAKMLVPLLIAGYIAACIFYPLSNKLTGLICGREE